MQNARVGRATSFSHAVTLLFTVATAGLAVVLKSDSNGYYLLIEDE